MAYNWDDQARKYGAKYGVMVDKTPGVGDIVVWERCPSAPDGHVAYVTNTDRLSEGLISIVEDNWSVHREVIRVNYDDMSFISLPDQDYLEDYMDEEYLDKLQASKSSSDQNESPVDLDPNHSSDIFRRIFEWIRSIFR